jgi:aspartate aminotransferase
VVLPKAAFYFFPDISHYIGKTLNGTEIKNPMICNVSSGKRSRRMCRRFSFGSPECIRFSYAASEEELRGC